MNVDTKKLRDLLHRLGLRQFDISMAMGLSKQTFSLKMTGKNPFRQEELEVLAQLLGADEMDRIAPGWNSRKKSICTCLRTLRVSFLRKKMSEVAEDLGVSVESVSRYEGVRTPSASYIVKFATTYHIPCSILLNIDEDNWTECRRTNLVLDAYDRAPELFVYAIQGYEGKLDKDRCKLHHLMRDLIYSLNDEELEIFWSLLKEMAEKRTAQNRVDAYREITAKTRKSRNVSGSPRQILS